jgi:hypothetical protein
MAQRGLNPQSFRRALDTSQVNIAGVVESIYEPRYDYTTLPAIGAASLAFFQTPIGQGGKTLADTNMELAGQIPKGQNFQITGVQVEFYSGADLDAAARNQYANDVMAVYKGGSLVLRIGSKEFIRQGNLMSFPPVSRLDGNSATGLAAQTISYFSAAGREFAVEKMLLTSNQNFGVTLEGLPALPSGLAGRIGVKLNGFLFRNAQ